MPWYETLTTKDAATLVGVVVDDKAEDKHVACIEELASALKPSSFTLTAVSQTTNMVLGYVYAKFEEQELTIGQVKVDRGHQGKGLGGLLLGAAERRARGLGWPFAKVNLSVLETNEKARRCYTKAGFKVSASAPSRAAVMTNVSMQRSNGSACTNALVDRTMS
ncbi:BXL6 [Symbiodinium sp. CCMP2456]|nr:BXL6 [Symbiodinium sp. CCMP2456]